MRGHGPNVETCKVSVASDWNRTQGRLIEAEGEAYEDLAWWLNELSRLISFGLEVKPVSTTIATNASEVILER